MLPAAPGGAIGAPTGIDSVVPHARMRARADVRQARSAHRWSMTFLWFVVWLIANNVGAHEPLTGNPVNAWAGTLILAVALDLSAAHATRGATRSR
jgi:hypothetical protein